MDNKIDHITYTERVLYDGFKLSKRCELKNAEVKFRCPNRKYNFVLYSDIVYSRVISVKGGHVHEPMTKKKKNVF